MLQWNGFLQTQKVNVVCSVYSVRHSIDVMSNCKGESLFGLNQKSSQSSSDLVLLTKTTCSCDMPIFCLETSWKTLHFIFTRKDNSAFKLVYYLFRVYISRKYANISNCSPGMPLRSLELSSMSSILQRMKENFIRLRFFMTNHLKLILFYYMKTLKCYIQQHIIQGLMYVLLLWTLFLQ